MSDKNKGTVTRDAGLILAVQKVEHYEIATYNASQICRKYGP
ncbi:DUF892 family protein [Sphingobacterium siyangense]